MRTTRDADVIELVSQLVRVESITPWLIPTGSGEAAVVTHMARWLADVPVDVVVDELEPRRANLVATLKGTGGGPTLCLNAHADTVGFDDWVDEALVPRVEGDRLYGLGAADDKGCCAAALLALEQLALQHVPLRGDLVVACVADEEGASIGTERLLQRLHLDAAIVLEPDALPRVVVEHQGFGWIDIVVHGRSAHGSAPQDGIDAIVVMGEIISRLHRWDIEHFCAAPDQRNGRTVFHTGTIRGGTDYATYPSTCTLGIEIGTQTGESLADRVAEIETIFADVRRCLPEADAEVRVKLDREPFLAAGHEPLLDCLDRSARQHLGAELSRVGLNAWTDAALMQAAGVPTVLLGPLGGNFHAPNEWVSISEVGNVCDLIVTAAADFLS
ncbi:MAG: M20/M25/M40 family metallo-hydrolase [Nocardioidaceae bacterium]